MELLEAKIRIPGLHQDHLPRHRLVKKINSYLDRKLCLVSAQAGYGKTKLLSEFALMSNTQTAWLTLDQGDNGPERFLSYLLASFKRILPDIDLPPFQTQTQVMQGDIESILVSLINRLASQKKNIALVMDQYHVIRSPEIHKIVEFLIEHKPDTLYTFILTRSDPPLPLARWGGRQELAEIRTQDLVFTSIETREFLNGVLEFGLSNQEINNIILTTQGWAVGVYHLALQLHQRTVKQGITGTLRASKAKIMDYIRDEVFSQLPEETISLMRQTSILEGVSAELCQFVTGNPRGDQILQWLEANNLFVSFSDEKRRWFKYHPLIAEYLKKQLARIEPQNIPMYHSRAGNWFAENGNTERAIHHFIEAEEFHFVEKLLTEKAFDWINEGNYEVYTGWADKLPRDAFSSRPLLIAFYLLCLAESRQVERFETVINLIENLDMDAPSRGVVNSALAMIEFDRNRHDRAYELAEKNLADLAPHQGTLKPIALAVSSSWLAKCQALLAAGRYREAEKACNAALPMHLKNRLYGYAIATLSVKGAIRLPHGKLNQAEEVYSQGRLLLDRWNAEMGKPSRPYPVNIRIFAPLARLAYERNQLSNAEAFAFKAIECGLQFNETWTWRMAESYILLAHIKISLGDQHAASEILEKIFQLENAIFFSPVTTAPALPLHVIAKKMDLMIRMAKQRPYLNDLIAEWGEENRLDQPASDSHAAFTWAKFLFLHERGTEALQILQPLTASAQRLGLKRDLAHFFTLEALALHQTGKSEKALATLQEALSITEPEGYCRVFADYGKPMHDLLTQYARRQGTSPYLTRLTDAALKTAGLLSETATQPNLHRLNANELQIIRLMEHGYSNKQIAEAMHLSINTVKWYSYRIFSAFGVKNRREAIARARVLNLL